MGSDSVRIDSIARLFVILTIDFDSNKAGNNSKLSLGMIWVYSAYERELLKFWMQQIL